MTVKHTDSGRPVDVATAAAVPSRYSPNTIEAARFAAVAPYSEAAAVKLTAPQRKALLLAYAEDWVLCDGDSISKRTLGILGKAGLIECDDGDDEYRITPEGEAALGLQIAANKVPKRMFTAIQRAVDAVFHDEDRELHRGSSQLPQLYDEGVPDWDGVVAVGELSLVGYGSDEDDDELVRWSAVATLVTAMGFPCHCDIQDSVAILYKAEE